MRIKKNRNNQPVPGRESQHPAEEHCLYTGGNKAAFSFLKCRYFISLWTWSSRAFTCEIRRQETAGSESQTVGRFSKIGIFPPQDKTRPLPSAERSAFLFLHQEISDKRIHYQGFHPDQTSKISSESLCHNPAARLRRPHRQICDLVLSALMPFLIVITLQKAFC